MLKNTQSLKRRKKLNSPITNCKGGRAGLGMKWNVDSESCEVWKQSEFSKQIMDECPARTGKQELTSPGDHPVCTSSADRGASETTRSALPRTGLCSLQMGHMGKLRLREFTHLRDMY